MPEEMMEQQVPLQQIGAYNVDIVMCIDGTASMAPIIDEVKKNALDFYQKFVASMEKTRRNVGQLRIKLIVFRDYGCDTNPMEESEFFTLPDQKEEFDKKVKEIEAQGGGDLPENALEAIALAMKSDWTQEGNRRRHVILVFTDASALPLGERAGEASYPEGMPKSFDELHDWWHGYDQNFISKYQTRAGRLVVFAPEAEPWSDLVNWNRVTFKASQAGQGLSELDIQEAIGIMVGSFV
jgi:hypothetical protein